MDGLLVVWAPGGAALQALPLGRRPVPGTVSPSAGPAHNAAGADDNGDSTAVYSARGAQAAPDGDSGALPALCRAPWRARFPSPTPPGGGEGMVDSGASLAPRPALVAAGDARGCVWLLRVDRERISRAHLNEGTGGNADVLGAGARAVGGAEGVAGRLAREVERREARRRRASPDGLGAAGGRDMRDMGSVEARMARRAAHGVGASAAVLDGRRAGLGKGAAKAAADVGSSDDEATGASTAILSVRAVVRAPDGWGQGPSGGIRCLAFSEATGQGFAGGGHAGLLMWRASDLERVLQGDNDTGGDLSTSLRAVRHSRPGAQEPPDRTAVVVGRVSFFVGGGDGGGGVGDFPGPSSGPGTTAICVYDERASLAGATEASRGRVATAGTDGAVRLWTLSGRPLRQLLAPPSCAALPSLGLRGGGSLLSVEPREAPGGPGRSGDLVKESRIRGGARGGETTSAGLSLPLPSRGPRPQGLVVAPRTPLRGATGSCGQVWAPLGGGVRGAGGAPVGVGNGRGLPLGVGAWDVPGGGGGGAEGTGATYPGGADDAPGGPLEPDPSATAEMWGPAGLAAGAGANVLWGGRSFSSLGGGPWGGTEEEQPAAELGSKLAGGRAAMAAVARARSAPPVRVAAPLPDGRLAIWAWDEGGAERHCGGLGAQGSAPEPFRASTCLVSAPWLPDVVAPPRASKDEQGKDDVEETDASSSSSSSSTLSSSHPAAQDDVIMDAAVSSPAEPRANDDSDDADEDGPVDVATLVPSLLDQMPLAMRLANRAGSPSPVGVRPSDDNMSSSDEERASTAAASPEPAPQEEDSFDSFVDTHPPLTPCASVTGTAAGTIDYWAPCPDAAPALRLIRVARLQAHPPSPEAPDPVEGGVSCLCLVPPPAWSADLPAVLVSGGALGGLGVWPCGDWGPGVDRARSGRGLTGLPPDGWVLAPPPAGRDYGTVVNEAHEADTRVVAAVGVGGGCVVTAGADGCLRRWSLWGGLPPATGRPTMTSQVMSLRLRLGEQAGVTVAIEDDDGDNDRPRPGRRMPVPLLTHKVPGAHGGAPLVDLAAAPGRGEILSLGSGPGNAGLACPRAWCAVTLAPLYLVPFAHVRMEGRLRGPSLVAVTAAVVAAVSAPLTGPAAQRRAREVAAGRPTTETLGRERGESHVVAAVVEGARGAAAAGRDLVRGTTEDVRARGEASAAPSVRELTAALGNEDADDVGRKRGKFAAALIPPLSAEPRREPPEAHLAWWDRAGLEEEEAPRDEAISREPAAEDPDVILADAVAAVWVPRLCSAGETGCVNRSGGPVGVWAWERAVGRPPLHWKTLPGPVATAPPLRTEEGDVARALGCPCGGRLGEWVTVSAEDEVRVAATSLEQPEPSQATGDDPDGTAAAEAATLAAGARAALDQARQSGQAEAAAQRRTVRGIRREAGEGAGARQKRCGGGNGGGLFFPGSDVEDDPETDSPGPPAVERWPALAPRPRLSARVLVRGAPSRIIALPTLPPLLILCEGGDVSRGLSGAGAVVLEPAGLSTVGRSVAPGHLPVSAAGLPLGSNRLGGATAVATCGRDGGLMVWPPLDEALEAAGAADPALAADARREAGMSRIDVKGVPSAASSSRRERDSQRAEEESAVVPEDASLDWARDGGAWVGLEGSLTPAADSAPPPGGATDPRAVAAVRERRAVARDEAARRIRHVTGREQAGNAAARMMRGTMGTGWAADKAPGPRPPGIDPSRIGVAGLDGRLTAMSVALSTAWADEAVGAPADAPPPKATRGVWRAGARAAVNPQADFGAAAATASAARAEEERRAARESELWLIKDVVEAGIQGLSVDETVGVGAVARAAVEGDPSMRPLPGGPLARWAQRRARQEISEAARLDAASKRRLRDAGKMAHAGL